MFVWAKIFSAAIPRSSACSWSRACRSCHEPLPYDRLEWLTALLFGILAARFGPQGSLVAYSVYTVALAITAAIDLRHRYVYSIISMPALLLALALTPMLTGVDFILTLAGIGAAMSLVKAGSGRAYYIGLRTPQINEAMPAVCVLARGTDEGTVTRLDHPFTVITNRPLAFSLYSSIASMPLSRFTASLFCHHGTDAPAREPHFSRSAELVCGDGQRQFHPIPPVAHTTNGCLPSVMDRAPMAPSPRPVVPNI